MKYKRVKRSGILFVFLSIITLRIYTLFYLHFVGKDVNTFAKKRLMPYPIVWILDWIFLGIPTLIYMSTLSRRVEEKAVELSVYDHRTGFGKFFNWCFFGSLIIVGPFIAYCSTFRTLNAVLKRLNVAAPAVKPVAMSVESPTAASPEKKDGAPIPDVIIVRPSDPTPVPAQAKAEDIKLIEQMKPEPAVIFEGCAPQATKKWRVRYASRKDAVMSFASQEEAINFAKDLAMKNGSSVRVKGR